MEILKVRDWAPFSVNKELICMPFSFGRYDVELTKFILSLLSSRSNFSTPLLLARAVSIAVSHISGGQLAMTIVDGYFHL